MSLENYYQEKPTNSQTEDKEGKTEEGNWHMLLEWIDETKKILLNKFCDNNPNLKEWFYNFLKYTKKKSLIRNANEDLKKCETEEDVRKFVENHQGVKVGTTMDERINITKTNIATAEVAEETEVQKKKQRDTDVAQRDTDVAQNKEQQETAEKIRTNKITEEEHKRLLSRYPELGEKTDKNSDLYKNVEEGLKNKWVIKQLEEVGKEINDSNFVEKYISYQATLQELSSNRANYDKNDISLFERAVKNLNNACNIPDTRLSSFSKENIWQTRTDLFAEGIWNQSLIEARNNNVDLSSHKKAYEKMFPEEMGEDAIFVKYWQFLEWDLKKYWEQYKDNYKWFMDNLYNIREQKSQGKELTPEEENILKIPWMLKWIKENFDESAKNMIEEMCLITQVNAMAKCIWQEGFGLNKANDIKYDETWAMVLDGHIDGVDFSVRHNFNEARAPLQTSSKLIESADGNTLEFWVNWKQKFKDSPFKLPSQESIFGMVSDFVASTNFSGERFSSVEDYIDNMQEWIVWKMDDVFDKDAEVANDYMQNEIKWEKIVDGSLWLIQHIKPSIDFTRVVNKNDNGEIFPFLKIIKFNIDNTENLDDKDKLNKCIWKIMEITDNYKNNQGDWKLDVKYPPLVENYLKNETWLSDWNEEKKLWLISDLFKYYSEKSENTTRNEKWNENFVIKIMTNDLYRDLFESNDWNNLSKPAQTRNDEQRVIANNEKTEEEKEKADSDLVSALADFPPSPINPSQDNIVA